MSNERFLILKEIDSLLRMKIKHEKFIEEENNRLTKLNKKLAESAEKLQIIKKSIFELQNVIYEIEKKLEVLTKQKINLFSVGKDTLSLDQEIEKLEFKGLEFLEDIDKLKIEENDYQTFQLGLKKTIEEIKLDVEQNVAAESKSLENTILRISLGLEGIPAHFKDTFQKVYIKNLSHGPFTRNENGWCYFCRYKISRIDESEIDLQQQLKQCPQCSRIFLPYGT